MDMVEQPIQDRHGQRLVAGEDLRPGPNLLFEVKISEARS